jgi:hypothetical protein
MLIKGGNQVTEVYKDAWSVGQVCQGQEKA